MGNNADIDVSGYIASPMPGIDPQKANICRQAKNLLPGKFVTTISKWKDQANHIAGRMAAREPMASFLRLRLNPIITKMLGRAYRPLGNRIEIDITYACGQGCLHCDRSCFRAPSAERMALEQVQQFTRESLDQNRHWEQIAVLGGEPTTHPDLLSILGILLEYRQRYSPDTRLILKTHGNGDRTKKILHTIPPDIIVRNSAKLSPYQMHFAAFNVAPCDLRAFRAVDYTNGCSIPMNFGCGLTPYGYYACPVMGGGIDRVFGFGLGRKQLPAPDDMMLDQLRAFCPLCGHFLRNEGMLHLTKWTLNDMSPTWKKGYEKYRKRQPVLERYY